MEIKPLFLHHAFVMVLVEITAARDNHAQQPSSGTQKTIEVRLALWKLLALLCYIGENNIQNPVHEIFGRYSNATAVT